MTTMHEPYFEVARSLASGFLATASVASAPQGAPTCRQWTQVDSTDLVLSDDLRSHLIIFFSSILFF